MRVFFSAGEASGDAYAAELLRRLQPEAFSYFRRKLAELRHDESITTRDDLYRYLREDSVGIDSLDLVELVMAFEEEYGVTVPNNPSAGKDELLDFISQKLSDESRQTDIAFQAIGGKRLQDAGARIVADSSRWGALGIIEALKVAPRVIGGYYKAKAEMRRGRPGLFIPIDFGFMNVKLARHAKKCGWKVLYFIPPGSWRKTKQGSDLPSVTDAIVTPFPWSRDILNEMGANAHYFGHPLKEMVAATPEEANRDGIAILPGSRSHEIESNIPVIAEAVKGFSGPVRIALAPTADEQQVRRAWMKWSDHGALFFNSAAAAMKASRSAIVCSGTATLEAALCGCPCVVMYRGNWMMELEYRIRRPKFEFISQPNILLGRPLLKELIQWDATSSAVREELEALDRDGSRRDEVLFGFKELADSLGETHCLERTAELAKTML